MIELDIPKDIKDFEPKFILGLTMRQAFSAVAGFGAAIISYNILKNYFDNKIKILIPLVFVVIAFLIGWVKIYGMTFEKYIIFMFSTGLSNKRPYKIENRFEVLEKEVKKEEISAAKEAAKNNRLKENGKISGIPPAEPPKEKTRNKKTENSKKEAKKK